MSEKDVLEFIEKVKSTPDLQEKVKEVCASPLEELLEKVVALAEKEGFEVSIKDLKEASGKRTDTHCIPWGL